MKTTRGFSLVEIMIGLTLGGIISIAVLGVYMAQKNSYKTNVSQASIQNAESAISQLVTPTVRAAGFCGCASILRASSNLNAGGAPPLGTLNTSDTMVMGYAATLGSPMTITQDNATNSMNAANWSPNLDASLVGNVQATSDVLVVLGATPGSQPIDVTANTSGSNSVIIQNAAGIAAGQFAVVSDCAKSSVFAITSTAGTTITHASSAGALANTNSVLLVNYPPGSQFMPLSQTAFFVASDPSGQSSLMRATLNPGGTWRVQSLIPGVNTMKVLYGIGSNGLLSQYVSAGSVGNWGQVYAIRMGFLIEGQVGSEASSQTQFSVIGTTVNVPADNRLRHAFELTITLRNSLS